MRLLSHYAGVLFYFMVSEITSHSTVCVVSEITSHSTVCVVSEITRHSTACVVSKRVFTRHNA